MNKWIARIILLGIVLFLLWIYYKKKNGLLKKPKTKGLANIHDSIFKIAFNFINYAQYKEEVVNNTENKQKKWKTENKCRNIIEKIYNAPFPSVRPDFLKSPITGHNLELDCYNEELKIAIEYNGKQHYSYTPFFHKTKRDFYAQVHRDNWKREKCQENGIVLIEIPYHVEEENLETYIKDQLKLRGLLYI